MDPLHIVAFSGSLRRQSLNRTLIDIAGSRAAAIDGVEVDVIDLRDHPLPLYDADLQERDGIPDEARRVFDRIAASDALMIANPEYNGGYPAVFKNLVDWVSRIDMFVFHPRYVGLLSATPGKGGGLRGIEHTRALFDNIFVTSHAEPFGLPSAGDVLEDGALVDPAESQRLDDWVDGFVAAARANAGSGG